MSDDKLYMNPQYIVPLGYENLSNKLTLVSHQYTDFIATRDYNRLIADEGDDPYFFENIKKIFIAIPSFEEFKLRKALIIQECTDELVHLADDIKRNNVITPWTIELGKEQEDYQLDLHGPVKKELSVVCTFNGKSFSKDTIKCNEETMFGMLSVADERCTFYLEDISTVPITLGDLIDNYLVSKQDRKKLFTAKFLFGEVTFYSLIDVMRGLHYVTSYLGLESRDYIKNIKENGIPVNF